MTYPEFILALKKNDIEINPSHPFDFEIGYYYPEIKTKSGAKRKGNRTQKNDILMQYWRTGGASGGGYWDGAEVKEDRNGDERPKEFKGLIKVLTLFAPKIGFLEYKQIEMELIKEGDEADYQGYGNRDDYSYEWVNLPELYSWLVKHKYIDIE